MHPRRTAIRSIEARPLAISDAPDMAKARGRLSTITIIIILLLLLIIMIMNTTNNNDNDNDNILMIMMIMPKSWDASKTASRPNCGVVAHDFFILDASDKRELEYRNPRLHSPINSRRFPDIFGDFYKNKQASCRLLWTNKFSPVCSCRFP